MAARVGSSTSSSHWRKLLYLMHVIMQAPLSAQLNDYYRGDIYAEDSIELLKSCGINFEKFEKDGIDVQYFGELLTMSGLVLSDNVRWISFHSSYDFGYLLKILTCAELPIDEQSFLDLLQIFFPKIFDVKVSI